VLSEYGLNEVWSGGSWLDAILRRFPRLTRIQLLALRNPFRKRGRLILSLVTLTFAGAVFMASINLQASLNETLNHVLHFWRYDAWVILDEYVPVERLESEAMRVNGVTSAEAWDYAIGRYVRPDDSESDDLYIMAPPKGTRMIDPPIIAGRGLRPDDENAILVTPGFLSIEPGLKLGSTITLKIDGRKQDYQIVGIMNMLSSSSIGYFTITDYNAFAHQVREMNRANAVVMTLAPGKIDWHDDVSSQVEDLFDKDGMDVVSTILIDQEREETDNAFQIIVALLLVMTILLAAVGGLGLAGTMSLNVIDRTREIGVMRAFGASSRHIFRVVIVEGLVIGGISWVLSILLAVPLSMGLASVIGVSFMNNPMPAAFSPAGVLYWALLVTAIAVVASISPALRAIRLTVTEVLAYE
jgi:putative ABC transport system permease protein